MYYREEIITPEIAQEYLKFNERNRDIRWSDVIKYARDMKRRSWQKTPVPIVFGKNGKLKDGQHRLYAVIEAGVPVEFQVAYDVDDDVTVFDRGIMRTTADIMRMSGMNIEASTQAVVSLVNFLFFLGNVKVVSDQTKIEFVTEHEDDLVKAVRISSTKSSKQQNCKKSPVIAAVYCAIRCGLSADVLKDFISIANDGFTDSPTKYAAVVLRNYITQEYTGHTSTERRKLFMIATNAIKDFALGVPRKNVYKSNTKPMFWDNVKKIDMDKHIAEYKKTGKGE